MIVKHRISTLVFAEIMASVQQSLDLLGVKFNDEDIGKWTLSVVETLRNGFVNVCEVHDLADPETTFVVHDPIPTESMFHLRVSTKIQYDPEADFEDNIFDAVLWGVVDSNTSIRSPKHLFFLVESEPVVTHIDDDEFIDVTILLIGIVKPRVGLAWFGWPDVSETKLQGFLRQEEFTDMIERGPVLPRMMNMLPENSASRYFDDSRKLQWGISCTIDGDFITLVTLLLSNNDVDNLEDICVIKSVTRIQRTHLALDTIATILGTHHLMTYLKEGLADAGGVVLANTRICVSRVDAWIPSWDGFTLQGTTDSQISALWPTQHEGIKPWNYPDFDCCLFLSEDMHGRVHDVQSGEAIQPGNWTFPVSVPLIYFVNMLVLVAAGGIFDVLLGDRWVTAKQMYIEVSPSTDHLLTICVDLPEDAFNKRHVLSRRVNRGILDAKFRLVDFKIQADRGDLTQ